MTILLQLSLLATTKSRMPSRILYTPAQQGLWWCPMTTTNSSIQIGFIFHLETSQIILVKVLQFLLSCLIRNALGLDVSLVLCIFFSTWHCKIFCPNHVPCRLISSLPPCSMPCLLCLGRSGICSDASTSFAISCPWKLRLCLGRQRHSKFLKSGLCIWRASISGAEK